MKRKELAKTFLIILIKKNPVGLYDLYTNNNVCCFVWVKLNVLTKMAFICCIIMLGYDNILLHIVVQIVVEIFISEGGENEKF